MRTRAADQFTTTETADAAGLTYRQLDHWCRIGLVRPAVAAHGSGATRYFSPADVALVRVAAHVVRATGSLELTADALAVIDVAQLDERAWLVVPVGGDRPYVADQQHLAFAVVTAGDAVVIPVGRIARQPIERGCSQETG